MRKAKKANKKVPEHQTHSSSDTTQNDFKSTAMATILKVNNNECGVKPKAVPKRGAVAGQKRKLTNLHDQPSVKNKKNTNIPAARNPLILKLKQPCRLPVTMTILIHNMVGKGTM